MTFSDIKIRPYAESDEPGLQAVAEAAWEPDDVHDQAMWGEPKDAPTFARTYVAVVNADTPIGFATIYQNPFHYHPRDFRMSIAVAPHFRRRGVGRALHGAIISERVPGSDLARLRTLTRADWSGADAFLRTLGYRHLLLSYSPTLSVSSGAWETSEMSKAQKMLTKIEHAVRGAGYTVHTLSEILEQGVPETSITELCLDAYVDTHPYSPPTGAVEKWREVFLGAGCIREAFFVVMKAGRPVAFSSVRHGEEPGDLELMWDGVSRSEKPVEVPLRMALKARELAFARAVGARRLAWEVDSIDLAGMRVLEWLPFERGIPYQLWVHDFPRFGG